VCRRTTPVLDRFEVREERRVPQRVSQVTFDPLDEFMATAQRTITRGNGAGTCGAFFAVGTVVRLDARPAQDSSFLGWRQSLPGCGDASKISVARGITITYQPAIVLR
jgi:hypothetical protein